MLHRTILPLPGAVCSGVAYKVLLRSLSPPDRRIVEAMSPIEATADVVRAVGQGCAGVVDDYAVTGAPWGFEPGSISCPVVVFEGARDTLLPLSHAQAIAAALPEGELVIVPDAGHFLLHSHTGDVLDRLTA